MTESDADANAIQVRFDGVLRRFGHLTVVLGPATLLRDLNAARLRVRIGSRSCRAYVFRYDGAAAVVVPDSLRREQGRALGDRVELRVRLKLERLAHRVPAYVQRALEKNGADIDSLGNADRRQSLMLIGEARTPDARSARIAALVAACHAARGTARRAVPIS